MSPDDTTPTSLGGDASTKTQERGRFMVLTLPFLALAAWGGAVAVAILSDLNPPARAQFYRNAIDGIGNERAIFYGLAALSLALAGIAVWRKGLPWAYAAVTPLIILGTGNQLLLEEHLVPLLIFAACTFLFAEYVSALRRFDNISKATMGLDAEEAAPVIRFFVRYVVASAVMVALFAGFLYYLLVDKPWGLLAATTSEISPRMRDGLETQTALGITLFSILLFTTAALLRMIVDGVRAMFQKGAQEHEEPEGAPKEPVPVRPEGSA